MLMSSRIRSGGSRRAASNASLPPGTGRTLYPRSLSIPASTWRLAGVSSTTKMLAGCPAPLFGFPGFTEGSCIRTMGDRTTPRTVPSAAARSCGGRGPRPLGGRVFLPQRDVVAFLVVFHLIHEGADEHQAAP